YSLWATRVTSRSQIMSACIAPAPLTGESRSRGGGKNRPPGRTSAPPGEEDWVTGLCARRLLKCSYGGLQRLAVIGKVRTLVEPGVSPRYSKRDIELLVGAS